MNHVIASLCYKYIIELRYTPLNFFNLLGVNVVSTQHIIHNVFIRLIFFLLLFPPHGSYNFMKFKQLRISSLNVEEISAKKV